MRRFENDCCGCAVPGYPCLGPSCPNRHVEHIYCDVCGEDIDKKNLVEEGGNDYCLDCWEEKHGYNDYED